MPLLRGGNSRRDNQLPVLRARCNSCRTYPAPQTSTPKACSKIYLESTAFPQHTQKARQIIKYCSSGLMEISSRAPESITTQWGCPLLRVAWARPQLGARYQQQDQWRVLLGMLCRHELRAWACVKTKILIHAHSGSTSPCGLAFRISGRAQAARAGRFDTDICTPHP